MNANGGKEGYYSRSFASICGPKVLILLLVAALCDAAVPTPKEHLGYEPGADYKLADYNDIISYFQKLARASDRILITEFGKTAMGKPMYIAYISAPENLKKLDQYRQISRRLARGEPDEAEARKLAAQGKAIALIDSGLACERSLARAAGARACLSYGDRRGRGNPGDSPRCDPAASASSQPPTVST